MISVTTFSIYVSIKKSKETTRWVEHTQLVISSGYELSNLAVDMETAGLYGVAAECGAKAMALFTVSDHVITGEATPAEERQSTFNEMVKIALESI